MARPEQVEKDRVEKDEMASIHDRVSAQFGAAAAAYTTSQVHADPEALRQVVELAQAAAHRSRARHRHRRGTHRTRARPHVAEVVAYDMTEPMLRETAATPRRAASPT